jgi:hypothetical protein
VLELKKSSLPYHLITSDTEDKDELVKRWNKGIEFKTLVRFMPKESEDEV